jgi:hypothetical protein
MRIRVGCEMTYEFGQVMPMIAILNVHSSRVSDLERPDYYLQPHAPGPVRASHEARVAG